MAIIKLQKGTMGTPKVQPQKRLMRDYGVPTMRMLHDVSSENVGLRTGLTQPKLKKRNKEEAQKWGGCSK